MSKTLNRSAFVLAASIAVVSIAPALAASKPTEPDWPCQARFMANLSPGAVWGGPPVAGTEDWRANAKVAALVGEIAPRNVAEPDGEAAITAFAKSISGDKTKPLTLLFAGLFQSIDGERVKVIGQIKDFTRRQKALADRLSDLTAEITKIPADAQGDDAKKRAELIDQKAFAVRALDSAEKTVRYACDIPAELEGRLGMFARAIQSHLPQ